MRPCVVLWVLVCWIVAALPVAAATTTDECARADAAWPYGRTNGLVALGSRLVFDIGGQFMLGRMTATDRVAVSHIPTTPPVDRIFGAGDHAAITSGHQLLLIEVSDAPSTVGEVGIAFTIEDGDFNGDFVVLASSGGLHVVDAGDPQHPTEVGFFLKPGGYSGVAVSDRIVCATSLFNGLDIIDIADPSAPTVLGHLDQEGSWEYFTDVVVRDEVAFVTNDSAGVTNALRIVDVSDPTEAVVIASYFPASDPFTAITLSGSHLYLYESYGGGIHVVDVSDPADPEQVALFWTDSDASSIAVVGDLVLAATEGGLEVHRWTLDEGSQRVGGYGAAGEASRSVVVGDLVYLGGANLRLMSPGSGMAHTEIGAHGELRGSTSDLIVDGGTAYWLRRDYFGRGSLELIDVTNSETPRQRLSMDGDFDHVAVRDESIVVVGQNNLWVYLDTSGGAPTLAGSLSLPGAAHAVAISDVYVLVAVEGSGVAAVDVSNPHEPVVAGMYKADGAGTDIAVADDLALVTGFEGGLRAIDLSALPEPSELGRFPTEEPGVGVVIVGSCAVVAYPAELKVLDLTDPTAMVEMASLGTTGGTRALGSGHDLVVVAQGAQGALLVDMRACECRHESSALYIPAAATGPGVGTSVWSTDVVVNNPGRTEVAYEVRFLPEGDDNHQRPHDGVFNLEPGATAVYPDIVGKLVGLAQGSGAVRFDVVDTGSVLLNSRTKSTDKVGATYGQGIPAVGEENLIGADHRVRLLQLSESGSYRTNVGFMNARPIHTTIHVEFFSVSGVSLGQDVLELAPFSFEQWNRAFARVADEDVENGYVDVWSRTEGAAFFAYASVVDEVNHDPTFIAPLALPD